MRYVSQNEAIRTHSLGAEIRFGDMRTEYIYNDFNANFRVNPAQAKLFKSVNGSQVFIFDDVKKEVLICEWSRRRGLEQTGLMTYFEWIQPNHVQDMHDIIACHGIDICDQINTGEIPCGSDPMFSDDCLAFKRTEKRYNLNTNDYDIVSFYFILDPINRLVYEISDEKLSVDSFDKYLPID